MSWRACALPLGVAFAATLPAQIFTLDAGVRSPELPSVRERIEVRGFAHGDEVHATTDVTWSPDRRVETQLDVPWIWRDVRGGRVSGGTLSGLGDVRLRSKVALLRDDAVMRSDRVAVFGDVFVPTGDDDATLHGVVAPRDLQPGRGTFGAGLGLGPHPLLLIVNHGSSSLRARSRRPGLRLCRAAAAAGASPHRTLRAGAGVDRGLRARVTALSQGRRRRPPTPGWRRPRADRPAGEHRHRRAAA